MKTKMIAGALLFGVATALLAGCQGIKARTDNAEVTRGPRFDEDGKFTDEPEVTVPLWKSKGLKQKPQDVTPVKD